MFKIMFIGIIIVVLLIPLLLIRGVVGERQERRYEALYEVGSKWGGIQTVSGPLLTIPYRSYYRDDKNVVRSRVSYMQFLPDQVSMNAHVETEMRRRGIFDVPVYTLDLQCEGQYDEMAVFDEEFQDDVLWDEAHFFVGITDMRGIQETVTVDLNGETHAFEPGAVVTDLFTSGMHAQVSEELLREHVLRFSFSLKLNGSEELYFMPSGKETRVVASSTWSDPSFSGSYLPSDYEVTKEGFLARWQVSYLSRNYPQSWKSDSIDFPLLGSNIMASNFGVTLFLSVDHYHKVIRSVKYGLLFIALTFAAFFLFEMMSKLSIHPFQYLLVGFAMSLFYLLLLSLSEHLGFTFSYIISSICTIGLIVVYASHALVLKKRTLILSLLLLLLYACLFILLQLEDYALLYGTVVLLIVLALIMFLTRSVDWYSVKLFSQRPDV
jgi:inner membrane protein